MERQEVPVIVRYSGYLSYADLAPVLDEFREHFWTVEASVRTPDLSGRGGALYVPLDFVFDLARFVVEATAAGIIGNLATDGSKKLREAMLQFRNRDREPYRKDQLRPFGLHIGSLWLMYEGALTDAEFLRSIEAARPLAETLPNLESG